MAYDPNQTIEKMSILTAEAGGHRGRTVRLLNGKIPLSTSTYNHSQDDATKEQVAARIAALWNLGKGLTTAEIELLNSKGLTLQKLIDLAMEKVSSRASGTPRADQQ